MADRANDDEEKKWDVAEVRMLRSMCGVTG